MSAATEPTPKVAWREMWELALYLRELREWGLPGNMDPDDAVKLDHLLGRVFAVAGHPPRQTTTGSMSRAHQPAPPAVQQALDAAAGTKGAGDGHEHLR